MNRNKEELEVLFAMFDRDVFDNLACWFLRKIESKHCLKSLGE